ncbi:hypothetical protein [Clostridium tagluense]|uniref:hypothetical protein n=1 Tax=Clostridium tagluense TaxID=360422 RepID=UPI001C0E2CAC|nr:hypothetical protein [Clostridium tagluense]MBU3129713.1 hypothetical protein [Clostridium tagluense]
MDNRNLQLYQRLQFMMPVNRSTFSKHISYDETKSDAEAAKEKHGDYSQKGQKSIGKTRDLP